MYLTAQRVLDKDGQTAINAYYYVHGDVYGRVDWELPPDPEVEGQCGELEHQVLLLPGEGRPVQSYIDLVAPDATSFIDVQDCFIKWIAATASQRPCPALPWKGVHGDMRFAVVMNSTTAKDWKHEISALVRMCSLAWLRATLPP